MGYYDWIIFSNEYYGYESCQPFYFLCGPSLVVIGFYISLHKKILKSIIFGGMNLSSKQDISREKSHKVWINVEKFIILCLNKQEGIIFTNMKTTEIWNRSTAWFCGQPPVSL